MTNDNNDNDNGGDDDDSDKTTQANTESTDTAQQDESSPAKDAAVEENFAFNLINSSLGGLHLATTTLHDFLSRHFNLSTSLPLLI